MPRAPKPLQTLDLHIIDVFEKYFREFGVSRNQVVVRAGLGNNRAGKLFRKEGPGITAGEIFLLAGTLGIPASRIVREAEELMAAAEFDEARSALVADEAASTLAVKEPASASEDVEVSSPPLSVIEGGRGVIPEPPCLIFRSSLRAQSHPAPSGTLPMTPRKKGREL